ncbi:ABC transporter permease [Amycolatopsis sp. NPDC005232]|uniref:ABC transporter permease n=1 Tax=unclassified Amycolatopsis TaxID=2618356 RepID=UPI001C6A75E4|nr:ABC transporter permease [Amycolatopsis sp. DSM 110486]QYN18096.1 ABC transporter permease [Amycolatopsis sp. DSM 110486]
MTQLDTPPVRTARPSARPRRRLDLRILSVLAVVVVLAAWYLLTDLLKVVPDLYFPSIASTIEAGKTLGSNLALDFGSTAYRMLFGWVIGCALGVLAGLIMARSRIAYFSVNPLIEIIRPVPPIALIPFTILWFGLTDTQRIALAALPCFMTLAVTTMESAKNVNPLFVRAAQSLGASPNQIYRTVVLRAILPNLVASLRIAAALAWAVVVSAEYLGAQNGIGYLILQASNSLNTSVVLIGTATVTIGAFVFDQILRLVTKFLTRWVDRMS